eukprot:PhF_6_TR31467/c2_g1_i6/m.46214
MASRLDVRSYFARTRGPSMTTITVSGTRAPQIKPTVSTTSSTTTTTTPTARPIQGRISTVWKGKDLLPTSTTTTTTTTQFTTKKLESSGDEEDLCVSSSSLPSPVHHVQNSQQRHTYSDIITQAKQNSTEELPDLHQRRGTSCEMPQTTTPEDKYRPSLIPAPQPSHQGKPLLVLDIDETLVHSSFEPRGNHDVVLKVMVNGVEHSIYVNIRPGLREFLDHVSTMFEICVFTASTSLYANTLMDFLDPGRKMLGPLRLFREHCTMTRGMYVKDLSLLGRPLDRIIIIDNSPAAYAFQPRNSIAIKSYFDDRTDRELVGLIPLLTRLGRCQGSVYPELDSFRARTRAFH